MGASHRKPLGATTDPNLVAFVRAPTPLAVPRIVMPPVPPKTPPASASIGTSSDPEIVITPFEASSAPDVVISPASEGGTEPILLVRKRPPSEPEMEVSVEIEAELPPERVAATPARDVSGDSNPEITVSRDDGNAKVTETVTEDSEQTVTVTTEEPTRTRPVTADDASSVSGTIEAEPPLDNLSRSRRVSDGWGEE